MEVKVLERSDEAIECIVKGVPLALLNAIRRYSLAKVPTYAIDEVMIVVNTSSMFDEILAHRLSLIPLKTEDAIDRVRSIDPEVCEKCSSASGEGVESDTCEECFVHMNLEAEAVSEELTVYSGDIKSVDPYVAPVFNNIPIVVLAPGQRISLELKARLGRGLEHAKWSPATVAITKYVANIRVNKKMCNACKKCVEVCPKGILNVTGEGLVVSNIYDCILCKQCVMACPSKAIDVSSVEDEYMLRIESSGSLKPETIIREAVRILLSELKEFERFVSGIG